MSDSHPRTIPSLSLDLERAMQSILAPNSGDSDWCGQESLDGI